MEDIKNYSRRELKAILVRAGQKSYLAEQIFTWVYQKRVEDFHLMTDLSRRQQNFLEGKFYFSRLEIEKVFSSQDKAKKFSFLLEGKKHLEAVAISEKGRLTFCLSTQLGCKFGCKFCVSGKNGFFRNLTVAEIVNQYLALVDYFNRRPTNIVFMGMGEPLDNFNNLVESIDILADKKGIGSAKRRICISTVGIIPKIKELSRMNLGVKLSVSLHAAFDDLRTKIAPANKKYPLPKLMEVLKDYARSQRYPVTFEYVLLSGVNDSKKDALALAKLLKPLKAKVNLIPYNENKEFNFHRPKKEKVLLFQSVLKQSRIVATIRESKGKGISAACGQLGIKQ